MSKYIFEATSQRTKELAGDFIKAMERIAYSRSYDEVFNDFLDITICCFSLQQYEEDYFKIIKKYDKKYLEEFSKMLAFLIEYTQEYIEQNKPSDLLGDIYQNISSNYKSSAMGQFFTPLCLCEMMTKIVMGTPDLRNPIPLGTDPACGSGRTILSSFLSNRDSLWVGYDLDGMCVKMSIINFYLTGMIGAEVHKMDSLANKWYGGYRIELFEKNGLKVPRICKINQEDLAGSQNVTTYFLDYYRSKISSYNQELTSLFRLQKLRALMSDFSDHNDIKQDEIKDPIDIKLDEIKIPTRKVRAVQKPEPKIEDFIITPDEVENKILATFSRSKKDTKLEEAGQVSLFDFV